MTIFKHYLRRAFTEPIGIAIYIGAPAVMVALLAIMNQYGGEDGQTAEVLLSGGRDINIGFNLIMNMIIFQFMGILLVVDPLFRDLKKDMRWRLLSAPVPPTKLVFGNMFAHYIFAVASGLLLILVGYFFNSYMFTLWVMVTVLALVALIAMLIGVIFFYLCKTMALANTLGTVFTWLMVILQGIMFAIPPEPLYTIGSYHTPLAWSIRAIVYSSQEATYFIDNNFFTVHSFTGTMSDAMMNLGFLAGFAALCAVIVVFLSRRRAV